MMKPSSRLAVLLIAHGSRRPEANVEVEHLAVQLQQQGGFWCVQPAFLELAEPTIEAGADRCVAQQATAVILLPYFLSPGRHVADDLRRACDRLQQRYPQVPFVLAPPLGQHPAIADILLQHAQQAARSLDVPIDSLCTPG
ncbi:MAG: CbiX/SirB N-terminal domain-containing protein [Gemmataceae bacterium]|nr:CbiX/SirB N-terminal domain-containing protein [Gemmataceae bacterium]MCS7271211.1 CbiX/SirB N-terminal domain-containing protein [Gemmataceae bacterium]MDW8242747.1 CbiX/SirB N-terminal domain-containing protein [Thermogemmata sp.]